MNTELFERYNANPKGKVTQDCVIRALSLFLNKSYDTILNDLLDVYKHTGFHIADPVCFMYYLKQIPKIRQYSVDYTKHLRLLDLCEYVDTHFYSENSITNTQNHNEFSKITHKNCNKILVLLENTHLTFVKNSVIIDTWNCSCLKIVAYFYFLPEGD